MTERNRILLRAAAILTVAAALLCLYLGVLSLGMPMPRCVFLEVTGWQCPGCGISRALHALLHGHFAEAIRYNYFLLLSIPYLLAVAAVSWIPALHRRRRLHRVVLGPELAVSYVVLFAIWFVVRNLLGL